MIIGKARKYLKRCRAAKFYSEYVGRAVRALIPAIKLSDVGAGRARDTVQDLHLGMKAKMAAPDVGRNKPVRALSAGLVFPALRLPETSALAVAGRTYSGLRRDVYNDERTVWEREQRRTLRQMFFMVQSPFLK